MAIIHNDDLRLSGITKERYVVSQIRKGLTDYPIIMVSGPRKVGKTVALLQLAVEYENAEFIDCGVEADVKRLHELLRGDFDGLILLDEFQLLAAHADWMHAFVNKSEQAGAAFRVVLTGSVAAYTVFMSRVKGGGRNLLLHLPLITYLEYLHFTGKIERYDADLAAVDYGETFLDYMVLKDWGDVGIPRIDKDYVDGAARDIAAAKQVAAHSTSFLNSDMDDVSRALVLLSYALIDSWTYSQIFRTPSVGNRELGVDIGQGLREEGAMEGFSVWEAAKSTMTNQQISESLRYLLWTDLALCNYVVPALGMKLDTVNLTKLSLGQQLTDDELQDMFGVTTRLYATNPLIYSVIAENLWQVLEGYLGAASDKTKTLFQAVKQKWSGRKNRGGFLRDAHIVGYWIVLYLRGAYALGSKPTPLRTESFQDPERREIDIVKGAPENVLIEVAVKRPEKGAHDVNFQLAYTGHERCFVTTHKTLEKVEWNGVPIWRIPYPMLAAFLDRGEIPDDGVLANGDFV